MYAYYVYFFFLTIRPPVGKTSEADGRTDTQRNASQRTYAARIRTGPSSPPLSLSLSLSLEGGVQLGYARARGGG